MNKLNQRLDRLEKTMGMKQERFILIITAADRAELPEDRPLEEDEILPGVLCYVYGEPLSNDELAELRAKYAAERAARLSDQEFDAN